MYSARYHVGGDGAGAPSLPRSVSRGCLSKASFGNYGKTGCGDLSARVLIFTFADFNVREFTVSSIVPGIRSDCTMTCAYPLNARRSGALSISWLLGSPLPTPMILPGPSSWKRTRLFAKGTT